MLVKYGGVFWSGQICKVGPDSVMSKELWTFNYELRIKILSELLQSQPLVQVADSRRVLANRLLLEEMAICS